MSLTKVQINLGTSGNLSGSRSLASSSLASRITTAEDEVKGLELPIHRHSMQ